MRTIKHFIHTSRRGLHSFTMAALLIGACAPLMTQAQTAVSVVNDPFEQATTTAVTTGTASIVTTLKWVAQQITAALGGVAQSVGATAAQTANTQIGAQQAAMQGQANNGIDSRYEYSATACQAAAASYGVDTATAVATGSGHASSGGGSGSGYSNPHDGSTSSTMQKVLNVADGSMPAPPPEVAAVNAAKGACETYGSGSARGVRCTSAGLPASTLSGYPNADLRAETLFIGPQADLRNPRIKRTIEDAGKDADATDAFIRNIKKPLELRDLRPAELNTDDGRRYLALKDIYDARMDLASMPIRDLVSNRLPMKQLLPVVQQMVSAQGGSFVTNYLNQAYPNWNSKGISLEELRELEVQRRYMNGDWYTAMQGAAPDTVAREALMMQAAQMHLQNQTLNEMRKMNIYLGALFASSVRQEYQPVLQAAQAKAVR